jgi:hypothetical protein
MSIRKEQYQALLRTEELLRDLVNPKKRPKTQKEMRDRVSRCLKHFPRLTDEGEPIFSNI